MRHSGFVPLHLHTEYSLLDGAIRIDDLVRRAVEYRMPAVAVTDHGNLFGAVRFFRKAVKAGIKAIIGCEVYVAPGSRFDREKKSVGQDLPDEAAFHLILLAKDAAGYRNLTQLVSRSYLEGFYYKPRIDKDILQQYSGGLIGLTSCLKGEVPYYIQHGMIDRAREVALFYKNVLGPGNFFIELQDNGIPEQIETNRGLVELSRDLHIPLVATNDCHYLDRDDSRAHDILLCIQTGKILTDKKRMRFETNEFYFKSPDEMKRAFAEIPEAIENTLVVAERCNFEFDLGKIYLPHFDTPNGENPDTHLERLAHSGIRRYFPGDLPPVYRDRLISELKMIRKMGYSSYFLIVWDFIRHAREKDVPVGPGRGSAAGSLVAYALGITEIDPIRYNLLFERFLNPERISMPDIDVDFCQDKRQEVINYISDKYGKDHVAQIITFGAMMSKAAIRDVGRVLDVPYAEVNRIAKLVPNTIGGKETTIEKAIETEPQLKELYETNDAIRELLDIAKKVEGLPRHASIHAAGVVIAPEPLPNYLALYKPPSKDIITTQSDMDTIEKIGLLKFDFLGLKTLTVLDYTVKLLAKRGIEIDLSRIPFDDPATYELLSAGETTGVFQLESPGMRDILRRMNPNRFEELIALVALYRPGPMAWIDDYIKGKKGERVITYVLPQLKDILEETYGIILYQEQVMMIAHTIAGFSMGQADILRKAMGKKIPQEMEKQKEIFIRGAEGKGIPENTARELFEKVEPFAGYGFNKSHSAAYAYLAYQTAYMKTHYPVEFMAANLSADSGKTEDILKFIDECRSMNIGILSPDLNESDRKFRIIGSSIRFGLEAVKGLGLAAIENIISERNNGPYLSFGDFLSRLDGRKVNKKVLECLIKAGACDSLYAGTPFERKHAARADAMEMLNAQNRNGRHPGPSLFGEPVMQNAVKKEWDDITLLEGEKEVLGFFLSGHPLARHRKSLSAMHMETISDASQREDRTEVSVAGFIGEVRTKTNDKGITAYADIEDETGHAEVLLFSDVYRKYADYVRKGNLVTVKGTIAKAEKGMRLIGRDVGILNEQEIPTKYEVSIHCDRVDTETLKALRNLLRPPSQNGSASLSLKFLHPEFSIVLGTRLQPSDHFLHEVERLGIGTVAIQ